MYYFRLTVGRFFYSFFLLPVLFLFVASIAWAADVTIAWDANSESDLAGYKLCYGTSSGNYTTDIDVGNTTQYTVRDLVEGTTYYIAAKAYDTSDNESAFSKELVYTVPAPNSAPNQPATPTGPSSGYVQNSLSFDTSGSDPDGDLLTYRFNWGDGNTSAWGGAFGRTHSYGTKGSYCVKTQSKDTHNATSPWSACLNVTITIQQHTISTSVGSNGSISPSGPVMVDNGNNQSFTITPNQNYRIADVLVDGASVGSISKYNFNSVDRDHSISASFARNNQAPTSDAGADISVRVSEIAQLDGSGSSDADGDNLTYAWSFAAKPNGSNASLSDSKAVQPKFMADIAGSYTVQLVVNDGALDSTPDTVTISAINSTPTANAGADQSVLVNDTVQLNGSASSDVDGDSLTFTWSFVSRPAGSNAAVSGTKIVKPTFVVDVAGTYTLQLIVNDSTVDSAPDTVTISTENSAPVANSGTDQAVQVNDTVQLDGSSSSDADGDSLTYSWSIVSKPGSSSATLSNSKAVKPTFDIDAAGAYTVRLVVNDGTLNSAPDTVTISTENSAPVGNAGADQTALVNDMVQLDGSGSSDVDGDSLTYRWSFVSRPTGSNTTLSNTMVNRPTFVVDVAGTYILQLIVNDGAVNSAPDTVTISTDNSAPVSEAGADQVVQLNDTVMLDGDRSSDADGDTLTFKWSIVTMPDGSNAELSSTITRKPTFRADAAGTYTIQLIVNDGTDFSTPDTVTITTENASPVCNAGDDQSVEEGNTVTLSGLKSTDPDGNIVAYSWKQTDGTPAVLSSSKAAETTFIAPGVTAESETLTFQLTVQDAGGLQDVDTCLITVNRIADIDSDSDGVPDHKDAFPYDPNETLDTDGDGEGDNLDADDDNDGMPDTWELEYGLDPLKDDAGEDPDGDDITNINEYNLGIKPNHYEGNIKPDTPDLLSPENSARVSLTPLLETGEYNDPNIHDVHSKTQWKIIRAFDDACVFDVTSDVALTSITIPKQILEENTEYIWQARFIDNHDSESEWSEEKEFITDTAVNDADSNGVPDDQEVSETLDLDEDGTADLEQTAIKCISVEEGTAQICISIRDAENAVAIVSLEVDDPNDAKLTSRVKGKPNFIEFGLIDFKLLVENPGDETTVTIYLSKKAYVKGNCYKYDPVNDIWLEYSDFTEFSPNRKIVYLTLKDGGFGDADGIENGIIVDPLAFGSESDPNGGSSDSPVEELVEGVADNLSCFISTLADSSIERKLFAAKGKFILFGISALLLLFSSVSRFTDEVRRRKSST